MTHRRLVLELLTRGGGILKLRPEFVHRFYADMNRLDQRRLRRSRAQHIPERWIGSSVRAANPRGIPGGGLSLIAGGGDDISLKAALRAAPAEMLGNEVLGAHGAEFRILVKILDAAEPITFHVHATDAQVRRRPRRFPGHRFGKDEAYYFLDAPNGPTPYTHAGLHQGVTARELRAAIECSAERALELSPSFHQARESGFFVPAGVPHRPGTAITLEIQQPSDVYSLLRPPARDALSLIDWNASVETGKVTASLLRPKVFTRTSRGEVARIFPAEVCRKFAGDRVRVATTITYRNELPFVLLAWRGRGRIEGRAVRAGDEFFVTQPAAARGIELTNTGDVKLECFVCYPVLE
jgi:mannose-6-phosphate isomerase class I